MKKLHLFIFITVSIITIILYCYFCPHLFSIFSYNNIKQNKKDLYNSSNIEADKENKIMLASILKKDDEIIVTEDNIDNSEEIIKRFNLQNGLFIEETSRKKFLEIVNIACDFSYSIDNNGYLRKNNNSNNIDNNLTKKINNYIDSLNNTIIVKITNTYKKTLTDFIILDFMIERNLYVQTFDYNKNIKIVLINPDKLNETSDNLSKKEIYEEILLNI